MRYVKWASLGALLFILIAASLFGIGEAELAWKEGEKIRSLLLTLPGAATIGAVVGAVLAFLSPPEERK